MERFFCTTLWLLLANIAFCNDIFQDLTFLNEDNTPLDLSENITYINEDDMSHRLLDVLGKYLLSNDQNENIFINSKNDQDCKQQLETLLQPFANQNPKLKAKINSFINKVLNTVYTTNNKTKPDYIDTKTLHILCRQLIDQVKSIF